MRFKVLFFLLHPRLDHASLAGAFSLLIHRNSTKQASLCTQSRTFQRRLTFVLYV